MSPPNNNERKPANVNDGTLSRAESPKPGLLGWLREELSRTEAATESAYAKVSGTLDHGYQTTKQSYLAGAAELQSYVDSIPQRIAHAANWPELKTWAEMALGSSSFNVGLSVGLAKGLAGMVIDLAKLAMTLIKLQMKLLDLQKTFVLAGLYHAAHAPQSTTWMNPPMFAMAKAANWAMGPQLKAADERMRKLLHEVNALIWHPSDDFQKLFKEMRAALKQTKSEWVERWHLFDKLSHERKLSSQFEAGVMAGEVVFEVIMVILMIISLVGGAVRAGAAIARVASRFAARLALEFPVLAELLEGMRGVSAAERLAAAERTAALEQEAAAQAERIAAAERAAAERSSTGVAKSGDLTAEKVRWVDENAGMSDKARNYNDSAPGSRSNVQTRQSQAPALDRVMPDGSVKQVKFDGLDGNVLVDRKVSVVTTEKAKAQALRQADALQQNGLTGRWEVPNEAQAARAQKMFEELKITNIDVKVVPPQP